DDRGPRRVVVEVDLVAAGLRVVVGAADAGAEVVELKGGAAADGVGADDVLIVHAGGADGAGADGGDGVAPAGAEGERVERGRGGGGAPAAAAGTADAAEVHGVAGRRIAARAADEEERHEPPLHGTMVRA